VNAPHRWRDRRNGAAAAKTRRFFCNCEMAAASIGVGGGPAEVWAMSLIDQGHISKPEHGLAGRERRVARRRRAGRSAVRSNARSTSWSPPCALVLSPLFLFVAVMLRLTDPGPVFFGHKRVGLGGRSFRCLKFRTMCTDADAVLQPLLATDPEPRRNGKPRASCATTPGFPAWGACCGNTPSTNCRN
jgi:hypothetical protein